MTEYVVLDVFTDTPFGGNPLAVIPDATALPDAVLQKIAREFNFSETTFVYPPENPENTKRVRIFTPASELPFAGHPTIGTAVALAARGLGPDLRFELGVGPVDARAEGGWAEFTTHHPLAHLGEPDARLVAACAGVDPADLVPDAPPVIASVGLPFVLVQLSNLEALSRAAPVVERSKEARAKYQSIVSMFDVYLYVRDGDQVRARMFAPLQGIPEDPATGSAAAALAAHLAELEGGSLDLVVTQGVEMGRPSRIEVRVRDDAVTISGQAVEVMRGTLSTEGMR